MQVLKNSSIRQRLTYIIMSISFISVLLTTFTISVIGVYNLRLSIIKELDISASIVGDRNAAALAFGYSEEAKNNLNVFSVKQTITQACLYKQTEMSDPLGDTPATSRDELFVNYTNEKYVRDTQCPTHPQEGVVIADNRIKLMKSVFKGADKIGLIYIESTLEDIEHYIEKQTTIAFTVGLAALLVSYLLAISLQKAISRPILSLADTARQVSIQKDYSIRAASLGDVKTEYNNELVILTGAFNDMLSEIGARSDQLKKQNIDLEKAKDAAESANRAKSQFLANISHELRTPLNAIIGFSSILMNQLFGALGDQKYLEYARDINDSGTHLLDIINDILDLSKAEAGKLTLNYEEVPIAKALNKCLTILAERVQKSKLTIVTDVPKMLPSLIADRLRFIQILLNILSNAVKFTSEGGKINVAVRTVETNSIITHFVVSIQDTGIGMTKEDIEKAFQSFGQVDSGLNRKYEGTGLGLPLTKKLMELHFGSIDIESELGKGTLVTLTFPAVPPASVGYKAEE